MEIKEQERFLFSHSRAGEKKLNDFNEIITKHASYYEFLASQKQQQCNTMLELLEKVKEGK